MNNTQFTDQHREKISVDKLFKVFNNAFLSQNHIAVTPNCQNWLFLRPSTATIGNDAGVNPSYTNHAQSVRYPFMVWLILQNKPIGEYVERFLYVPRVRPHHPIFRVFTQNHIGAFTMNAKHITQATKQAVSAQASDKQGKPTYNDLQATATILGNAQTAFEDLANFCQLIADGDLPTHHAQSIARMANDYAFAWIDILGDEQKALTELGGAK